MPVNPNWEFKTDHMLMWACVGKNFGPNPEDRVPEIRAARAAHGHTVAARMGLTERDVVVDLGSGCGFLGRTIAPLVAELHCVDLSPDFLQFCSNELSEFENVEHHLIEYADYSCLKGKGVNRIYSTAVFIHFHFYDLYHNLEALAEILETGGTIYFDYADPEGIKDGDARIFNECAQAYREDRESIFTLVHYNGLPAIRTALEMTGFELLERWQTGAECFSVLIRKR